MARFAGTIENLLGSELIVADQTLQPIPGLTFSPMINFTPRLYNVTGVILITTSAGSGLSIGIPATTNPSNIFYQLLDASSGIPVFAQVSLGTALNIVDTGIPDGDYIFSVNGTWSSTPFEISVACANAAGSVTVAANASIKVVNI